MNNKIIITKHNSKTLVVFIKDNEAVKIRAIDNISERTNEIYLGRIQDVKNNINSCFVKYGNNKGFLEGKNLKSETVLPVMLKKETAGYKENEITDRITLTGVYSVVSNDINKIKFSSKIPVEKREKFNSLNSTNSIIRSNALNTDIDSVENELKYLNEVLKNINNIKDKRTDNSILYNGIPSIIDIIFSEDISQYDEILTDNDTAYAVIDSFFEQYKNFNINIPIKYKLHDKDDISLAALISLSSKLDKAINRKVYLKSGAYITIDYTEAMTVIDVNSGTTGFKGDKASVIHNINLEAAKEAVSQLKLRNLSGIIIIDFINEYTDDNKEDLCSFIKSLLKNDDMGARFHDITKLGLVEITRKRTYKTLREQLN